MYQLLEDLFPDRAAERTVVIIPSLSLDIEELQKISGVHHYEERLLCMLMLLRLPKTQVIFVTSQLIDPAIIDYYLHLLAGVPTDHARERLTMLHCGDASQRTLTEKILERPRLIERIKREIRFPESAHMACFNATTLEKTLSTRLNLPLYACDPDLLPLGGKSGGRKIFREAGVPMPDGTEDLRDSNDIFDALYKLKRENPELKRAVVKLNYGFSGEGNALFSFGDCPANGGGRAYIAEHLPKTIRFESELESWDHFLEKFAEMEGIVEEFLEGDGKQSPSTQLRIDGKDSVKPISTHDQVLGGPSGQVFLGAYFPAFQGYRLAIQEESIKIGEILARHGALARFGIDFLSIPTDNGWESYAIEINLRKGGTTHPFMMLDYLAEGRYDTATGKYLNSSGESLCYFASDNLHEERYRGLTPNDLIDIAVENGLHFHGAKQEGVVFHLISALSEFGKVGVECIAKDRATADRLYQETVRVLDKEVGADGA